MWYTSLVLATLKRSGDLTIGYVKANSPPHAKLWVSIAYPWPRRLTCGTPTWTWPPKPGFFGQRAISHMPSTHPASMGLPGAAIWEEIAPEQQDSLCIYLKGSLRSPLDNVPRPDGQGTLACCDVAKCWKEGKIYDYERGG